MLLKKFQDGAVKAILHKRQSSQHRGNSQKYRDHMLKIERVYFQ